MKKIISVFTLTFISILFCNNSYAFIGDWSFVVNPSEIYAGIGETVSVYTEIYNPQESDENITGNMFKGYSFGYGGFETQYYEPYTADFFTFLNNNPVEPGSAERFLYMNLVPIDENPIAGRLNGNIDLDLWEGDDRRRITAYYHVNISDEFSSSHVVPEPATIIMFGMGMTGFMLKRRKRQ